LYVDGGGCSLQERGIEVFFVVGQAGVLKIRATDSGANPWYLNTNMQEPYITSDTN